jgi:hypothetical protein
VRVGGTPEKFQNQKIMLLYISHTLNSERLPSRTFVETVCNFAVVCTKLPVNTQNKSLRNVLSQSREDIQTNL